MRRSCRREPGVVLAMAAEEVNINLPPLLNNRGGTVRQTPFES